MTIVRSNYGSATAFSIDVDNREYWITAKHVLTGAEHPPYGTITAKSATLHMLDPSAEKARWLSIDFSVLDAGKDIDIVVLAPRVQPLLRNPLPSAKATYDGVLLGGECEFLGYPSATGGAWSVHLSAQFYWMPFVKHCYVSSLAVPGVPAFILDGVNNPGFSGGPVIYRTGPDQQIIGVISGIVTEPAEVIPSLAVSKPVKEPKQPRKEKVDANSGFIVAYSIWTAIEAIHKEPIGPLRPSQTPH
jgi:hypothetical protein